MKTLIYLSFILSCMACKAQYNILSLDRTDQNITITNPNQPNYYKDLNDDLDDYVGTWQHQNGNTSFTLVLEKREQVPFYDNNIFDELVGEYQYVENGVELVNSLAGITNPTLAKEYLSTIGLSHLKYFPNCTSCDPLKPRVELFMTDPGRKGISQKLVLHHFTENGQEKLMGFVSIDGIIDPSLPTDARITEQEYIFIKQ